METLLPTIPPGASEHQVVSPPVGSPVKMVRLGLQDLLHVLLRADHHAVEDPEFNAEYWAVNLNKLKRNEAFKSYKSL